MNKWGQPSRSYYETSVTTSSPEQLVVMLYQGAIRHLKQATIEILKKDLEGKRHSIDRAVAIVQHLQNTLDMERGAEISVELDRLYTYMLAKILDGSIKLQTAPLEEAVKLLSTLLESWEEIARQKQVRFMPPAATPSVRLQMHG